MPIPSLPYYHQSVEYNIYLNVANSNYNLHMNVLHQIFHSTPPTHSSLMQVFNNGIPLLVFMTNGTLSLRIPTFVCHHILSTMESSLVVRLILRILETGFIGGSKGKEAKLVKNKQQHLVDYFTFLSFLRILWLVCGSEFSNNWYNIPAHEIRASVHHNKLYNSILTTGGRRRRIVRNL